VMWTGRAEGMERSLVAAEGIGYVALAAAPLVGQGIGGKLKSLGLLAVSAWRGRRLVRRLDARVVIGTGGYVSAPAVLGARLAGRPTLLLEPNARAGAANRMLARWASAAAVAFGEAAGDLSCRAEATGTPVRRGFFEQAARPAGGSFALLVLGGSQGAQQINELVPAALEGLTGSVPALSVRHQAGAAHFESVRADYARRDLGAIEVEVVPFLADMPSALGAADVVISRAGAITLAELCAAGRASILVPLRQAGDHQLDNARRLEEAGSAVVLVDDSVAVAGLSEALRRLLTDPERLAAMGRAAHTLASADAALRIADLVDQLEEAA
jgi:UDP-N-acetylglucosamine--N-acetylmuramyl-(pentapeptide) pyrophosphoryl-undecaprenol N-acetylglucosamine transferase